MAVARSPRPRLVFFNLGGGPTEVDGRLGFTEGGLVHAVNSLVPLSAEFEVTVVCPNTPDSPVVVRDVDVSGVRILSPGRATPVRWMRAGEMSATERPLPFLLNWPSVLSTYRSQKRFLRRVGADVVLVNGILGSYLVGLARGRWKTVAVIHHLYHDPWTTGAPTPPAGLNARVERFFLRHLHADVVAVVNPSVAECLVRYGFPTERIWLVGNGVDPGRYRPAPQRDENSLVFVGRLRVAKGVDVVIDAFSMIRSRRPEAVLHIVGDGLLRRQLAARAELLGVASGVVFHGFVAESVKVELLSRAALYLSASRFEGFGLPVVEAMAAGAVPIVSNIPSHRYIFQDRDVGRLVSSPEEMAECALELLQDRVLRNTLALRGRELVEHAWTWESVSGRYRQLIRHLLSSSDRL